MIKVINFYINIKILINSNLFVNDSLCRNSKLKINFVNTINIYEYALIGI